MVSCHLTDLSCFWDRNQSGITHIGNPAFCPTSHQDQNTGTTFMSQSSIFLQSFLNNLNPTWKCIRNRELLIQLVFDNEMKMVGKIGGGEMTSMTIKYSKILVDFVTNFDQLNCHSVFIFDPGTLVCTKGILQQIFLFFLNWHLEERFLVIFGLPEMILPISKNRLISIKMRFGIRCRLNQFGIN